MLEKLLTENGFYLHHQFKKDNIITEQTYGYGTIMIDFFGHFENGDSTSFYTYYREPDKAYDSENKMSVNEIRTRKISDTKIGDVIHKLFILSDDNIDVWMSRKDYDKLIEKYSRIT